MRGACRTLPLKRDMTTVARPAARFLFRYKIAYCITGLLLRKSSTALNHCALAHTPLERRRIRQMRTFPIL